MLYTSNILNVFVFINNWHKLHVITASEPFKYGAKIQEN